MSFRSQRVRALVGSLLSFFVLFGTLAALRATNQTPPTPVQSDLVNLTATAVVLVVGVFAYRGATLLDCWILAFGPAFTFTLNLVVTGEVASMAPMVMMAIVAAAGLSLTLTAIGYVPGRIFQFVADARRSPNGV